MRNRLFIFGLFISIWFSVPFVHADSVTHIQSVTGIKKYNVGETARINVVCDDYYHPVLMKDGVVVKEAESRTLNYTFTVTSDSTYTVSAKPNEFVIMYRMPVVNTVDGYISKNKKYVSVGRGKYVSYTYTIEGGYLKHSSYKRIFRDKWIVPNYKGKHGDSYDAFYITRTDGASPTKYWVIDTSSRYYSTVLNNSNYSYFSDANLNSFDLFIDNVVSKFGNVYENSFMKNAKTTVKVSTVWNALKLASADTYQSSTMLDTLNFSTSAFSDRNYIYSRNGKVNYSTAESMVRVGNYYVTTSIQAGTDPEVSHLQVHDLNGELKCSVITANQIGHANSVTYHSKSNSLYYFWYGKNELRYAIVPMKKITGNNCSMSGISVKTVSSLKRFNDSFFSMTYNDKNDTFLVSSRKTTYVLDSNLKYLRSFDNYIVRESDNSGHMTVGPQSGTTYKGILIVPMGYITLTVKHSDKTCLKVGYNVLDMYRVSDGKYIGSYRLNTSNANLSTRNRVVLLGNDHTIKGLTCPKGYSLTTNLLELESISYTGSGTTFALYFNDSFSNKNPLYLIDLPINAIK